MKNFTLNSFKNKSHTQIEASFEMIKGRASLLFNLNKDFKDFEFVEGRPPLQRKIGLWEKTCFEFFIGNSESQDYWEYNFDHQNFWNCFYLPSYRSPIQEFFEIKDPNIFQKSRTLEINFDLPKLLKEKNIIFNISCVIKVFDKESEYFALSHLGNPDFHNKKTWKEL